MRVALRRTCRAALRGELLAAYQAFAVPGPYSPDARSAGQRALKNLCLSYLMELAEPPVLELCLQQFDTANNMTDAMAALTALANTDNAPSAAPALERFYARWKDEPLVVDKWLCGAGDLTAARDAGRGQAPDQRIRPSTSATPTRCMR